MALHWVGTRQIRLSRREARSSTSQGGAEPLCARVKGAANGQDSWGVFRDAKGFGYLDAGSCAGFTSSRPPPPWPSEFYFFLILYDV